MNQKCANRRHSRREFLRDAALLGSAGMALPTLHSAPTPHPPTGRKVRIGIAGGRFGADFYWHEDPGCIVAAVTDLLPERRKRLMETYRCSKSYPSLEEMVKDPDLDAIAVFTDGPLHFAHDMLALSCGKHVISAVPAVMAHSAAEALDQAHQLLEKVTQTGLTYMMAETSCWQQRTISARQLYGEGALGQITCCDSQYLHPGLRSYYGPADKPTWRYGVPPMFYPTHCTAHLISLTAERLVQVSCNGWGDDDPVCRKNAFGNNPFWNETAHFRTNEGKPFRVRIWWEGPVQGGETANWFGTRMSIDGDSLFSRTDTEETDDAGFVRKKTVRTNFEVKAWWKTDLLPVPLRHDSGHEGSHTFIVHEFIDALVNQRRPLVDIREALAYTVPGIIAHQSALKDGESLKIPQFYS